MTKSPQVRTVAEVLEAAAKLIEPEGAWTQGADSRNRSGVDLNEADPDFDDLTPVCWCAAAAIQEAAGHQMLIFSGASAVLSQVTGVEFTPEWNDAPERTQAEVVAKLREASASARALTMTPEKGGDHVE